MDKPGNAGFDGELAAVLTAALGRYAAGHRAAGILGRCIVADAMQVSGSCAGGQEKLERPAEHLIGTVAKHALGRRAKDENRLILIDGNDCVGCYIQDPREQGLGRLLFSVIHVPSYECLAQTKRTRNRTTLVQRRQLRI